MEGCSGVDQWWCAVSQKAARRFLFQLPFTHSLIDPSVDRTWCVSECSTNHGTEVIVPREIKISDCNHRFKFVTGVYKLTGEVKNMRPVYEKDGQERYWWWHSGKWYLTDKGEKDADTDDSAPNNYAFIKTTEAQFAVAGAPLEVWNSREKIYDTQRKATVQATRWSVVDQVRPTDCVVVTLLLHQRGATNERAQSVHLCVKFSVSRWPHTTLVGHALAVPVRRLPSAQR
jgi:hypothetical protein